MTKSRTKQAEELSQSKNDNETNDGDNCSIRPCSTIRNSFLVIFIGVVLRITIWVLCNGGDMTQTGQSKQWWFTREYLLISETPLTSYSSLQEAKALIQLQQKSNNTHFITSSQYRPSSPYANDVVRVPPLVIYALDYLGCLDSRFRQFLFLLSIEVLTAVVLGWTVFRLQNQRNTRIDLSIHVRRLDPVNSDHNTSSNERQSKWLIDKSSVIELPWIIIAIYISNPINICSNFSLALDPLRLCLLSFVFSFSVCASNIIPVAISLASFAYVVPLPSSIAVAIAAGHSIAAVKKSQTLKDPFGLFVPISAADYFMSYWCFSIIPLLISTALLFCLLHLFSFLLMNNTLDYWDSCVTAVLTVRDLTPNLGLFWYMLQLVFQRFRFLFLAIYQMINVIFCVPLSLKFVRQPLGLMQVMISTLLLFYCYPTMIDFCFIITLLSIDQTVVRKLKEFTTFVAIDVFSLLFIPAMANLWLRRNSGNPNFLYAAQLVFTVTTSFLILQFAKTSMQVHTGDDGRFLDWKTDKEKND